MEGQVKCFRCATVIALSSIFLAAVFLIAFGYAQDAPSGKPEEAAQLRLRKTPVQIRQYRGKTVEGEEKVAERGDSVWRYVIQEKGLPERRFGRYLVLIGSLNPHIKDLNIIRVGDAIFIPLKPDEILGIRVASAKGQSKVYRVKKGEHLFKILREHFGLQENRELVNAFSQVRGLNPRKKDWDALFVGEVVLFPGGLGASKAATVDPTKPMDVIGLDYGRKLSARENLHLLEQVMGAVGHETQRLGEEVMTLREGKVHLDRDVYPVIQHPKSAQKVILDLGQKMPPALRSKLESQSPATPVVSVKKGANLHDTVSSLLSRLGFQFLPSDRPVAIQDRGVGLQVRGEWIVTASEQLSGTPEMFIISLSDVPGRTPEYLRSYLSLKGMNLKEILLPSSPLTPASLSLGDGERSGEVERWPAEKKAMVDALLRNYEVAFSTDHPMTVSVQEGIRLDTKADRYFEAAGRKVAVFFYSVGDAVRKALQEKEGITAVEIDLPSLSSREVIARLLQAFGQPTAYRENRFPATGGGSNDKVVLTVPGFLVADRSLFITDREIPKELEGFFAEKGLQVVYFH